MDETLVVQPVTRNLRIYTSVTRSLGDEIESYASQYELTLSDAVRDGLTAFFSLSKADRDALVELAKRSRRAVGDEGAILLSAAIKDAMEG